MAEEELTMYIGGVKEKTKKNQERYLVIKLVEDLNKPERPKTAMVFFTPVMEKIDDMIRNNDMDSPIVVRLKKNEHGYPPVVMTIFSITLQLLYSTDMAIYEEMQTNVIKEESRLLTNHDQYYVVKKKEEEGARSSH
ncbi:hypothetical protein ACHWQZ_G015103 [Mnemiopsis leidyi]